MLFSFITFIIVITKYYREALLSGVFSLSAKSWKSDTVDSRTGWINEIANELHVADNKDYNSGEIILSENSGSSLTAFKDYLITKKGLQKNIGWISSNICSRCDEKALIKKVCKLTTTNLNCENPGYGISIPSGYGKIGHVERMFNSYRDNIRGSTVQSMFVCQCLDQKCDNDKQCPPSKCQKSTQIRPIEIRDNNDIKKTFAYPVYNKDSEKKLLNCYDGLVFDKERKYNITETIEKNNKTNKTFDQRFCLDADGENVWYSFGFRERKYFCNRTDKTKFIIKELDEILKMDVTNGLEEEDYEEGNDLVQNDLLENEISTCPDESSNTKVMEYYVLDESQAKDIMRLYNMARISAESVAVREDDYLGVRNEDAFIRKKPAETSLAELFFYFVSICNYLYTCSSHNDDGKRSSWIFELVEDLTIYELTFFVGREFYLFTWNSYVVNLEAALSYYGKTSISTNGTKNEIDVAGSVLVAISSGGVARFHHTKILIVLILAFAHVCFLFILPCKEEPNNHNFRILTKIGLTFLLSACYFMFFDSIMRLQDPTLHFLIFFFPPLALYLINITCFSKAKNDKDNNIETSSKRSIRTYRSTNNNGLWY